ncbi:saccharopine dehydrogenase [Planosporangium flavigriseum]|uniref:Saccharopine dehydrogenase n=1 Tax=Planosporangium flavigriseum TaxID=373681 RepID=A0A8J3LSM5_9ACTN|nr:saccharopine dehydrogenase NADP-binding domain-containing protein [Planosporangium flavigriseum]NJC65868.1 saccharopine dehydrogenase [Planosporangium flavigriseum]GIG76085.1 saccharopine dehydrogenase [Planosporangium flavigriseum]
MPPRQWLTNLVPVTAPQRRDYDIALFGATGFTGGLTAEYLAAHAPAGMRWALAGRNREKLAALRDRLGVDVAILDADVTDATSLRRLAEVSRVVITTVGPYIRYGEPLVAACAAAGTDYVDLTGEPEFVDRMYLRHHATAERTGARLVHACGFDSIPHDLGALFTVEQFPPARPIRLRGYVSAGGVLSGGTLESAVTAFARFRQAAAVHRERRRAQPPRPGERRVRAVQGRPGYDRGVDAWVLPLPTIDPQIVARSAQMLEAYGPDFEYSHFLTSKNPLVAAGLTTVVAGTFALAQLPPTRKLLLRMRPSGTGPTPVQREKGWFRVRFIGESGDRRVVTEVAGGDPGYGETAKMLAESALCLAYDPLPQTAGQVTTAVAMGDSLRARLERAGITFRVISPG